jgi:polyhydroxyalkanoate synthesis regulator phasin
MAVEKRGPGRRTREEEAREWLRQQGKSVDDIPDKTFEMPEDPQQMLEEFTAELYKQMQRGELKNTSLVNGLKAVASLAESYRQAHPVEVVVEERGIDEILGDAGLPRDRRIDIGRQEIDRLRERTSALELVVARIEGEA